MVSTGLSLDAAVVEYLAASFPRMAASSQRAYAGVLAELQRAFAAAALSDFEPPEGNLLVSQFLETRWGTRSPRTYNRSVSIFRRFFVWHVEDGNLNADPMVGIDRKPVEQSDRTAFTPAEVATIFNANGDPRDALPLRLLLDVGVHKGSLRRLRFADFNVVRKEVIVSRGKLRYVVRVDDEDFWIDVKRLRAITSADDQHYVFPVEKAREYDATADEIRAAIPKDGDPHYLRARSDGKWEKVSVDLAQPRGEHGAHDWWYRCLERAGLVPPGTTSGQGMLKARHTVGRAVLVETGRVQAVSQKLGVGSGGSTGDVYSNRDSDQLEVTIRRLRRQLRERTSVTAARPDTPKDISTADSTARWWAEPLVRFVDYIEEERDLVELSRVSIEMLRAQDAGSRPLREAAETLTRVVSATKLLERARDESTDDHPLLHGHSLLAIWGAMETVALDVAVAWLQHREEARTRPQVSEIKVPLSTFESLDPEQRAEYLAHELDGRLGPRTGIDRFERLLASIGLHGDRDEILAKNIYEMQQIRHVFAHRQGTADAAFVRACRHLGYVVGEPMVIDRNMWSDFMVNALLYAETVLRRVKRELGVTGREREHRARPIRYTRLTA
jgi:integrase